MCFIPEIFYRSDGSHNVNNMEFLKNKDGK